MRVVGMLVGSVKNGPDPDFCFVLVCILVELENVGAGETSSDITDYLVRAVLDLKPTTTTPRAAGSTTEDGAVLKSGSFVDTQTGQPCSPTTLADDPERFYCLPNLAFVAEGFYADSDCTVPIDIPPGLTILTASACVACNVHAT